VWFAGDFLDAWWSPSAVLWFVMTVITLLGAVWAWGRHLRSLSGGPAIPEAPPRTEQLVLGLLSLSCLGVVIFCWFDAPPAFEPWWNLLLALSAGIWARTLYKLYQSKVTGLSVSRPPRAGLPTEGVMLWVALLGLITFAALRPGQQ